MFMEYLPQTKHTVSLYIQRTCQLRCIRQCKLVNPPHSWRSNISVWVMKINTPTTHYYSVIQCYGAIINIFQNLKKSKEKHARHLLRYFSTFIMGHKKGHEAFQPMPPSLFSHLFITLHFLWNHCAIFSPIWVSCDGERQCFQTSVALFFLTPKRGLRSN